jgi:hypothetical protein
MPMIAQYKGAETMKIPFPDNNQFMNNLYFSEKEEIILLYTNRPFQN